MTGSASDRAFEPAELRHLAQSLVEVLRNEFEIGTVDLSCADLISSGGLSVEDHAACLAVMCAQQLHGLGNHRAVIEADDVFVLASMLDFVLCRVDGDGSQTVSELREIHHRLLTIGLNLSRSLLYDGERRVDRG